MLNLPYITAPTVAAETAPARKTPTDSKSDSGFSDVFSEMSDAPDDTPQETAAQSDATSDENVEAEDSAAESGAQNPDSDDLPSDTETATPDFAAIATPTQTTETAEPEQDTQVKLAAYPEAKNAARGSSENAAMMKLAGQNIPTDADAAKTAAAESAVPKAAQAQTQASLAQAVAMRQMPPQTAATRAAPRTETLTLQGSGELDGMRVSARSSLQSGGAARPAPSTTATLNGQNPRAENGTLAEADLELAAPRPQAPAAGTAAQNWQSRAMADHLNVATPAPAGGAPIDAVTQAISAADPTIGSLEELAPRAMASAQEAASQAKLAQPAPASAQVVRQLADAVRTSAAGDNMIELTMDPPELGRLRMTLSEASGLMTVTIAAENQATTELMRRHIDMLRKDFQELGYQDVAFSFEQGDRGSQHGAQSDWSSSTSAEMADDPTLADLPQQMIASTGIDIRV